MFSGSVELRPDVLPFFFLLEFSPSLNGPSRRGLGWCTWLDKSRLDLVGSRFSSALSSVLSSVLRPRVQWLKLQQNGFEGTPLTQIKYVIGMNVHFLCFQPVVDGFRIVTRLFFQPFSCIQYAVDGLTLDGIAAPGSAASLYFMVMIVAREREMQLTILWVLDDCRVMDTMK